ncbi:MAG: tRNA (adenosine(37)-N6)-threonylcarbamoyltransferase complex dimerization subunit type 1 TsaB [Burkholderiaceae bacterium]|jgi:tRNA threonylcarbamoyladenosine biosynthesis protein TsaB|nr:tRNA (adenosine(37)-N6)-threonylcarbamoyltransferase complex dimerization subunit type 1 TsaB [Burkholderiaceae bacterium]
MPLTLTPRLLAFDTSTEQLSVALRVGEQVFAREAAGGAQASVALIPLVHELLAQAGVHLRDLDAIAFGRGPGAFTGLRTACAVAQGFGWGAGIALLPVDTLLAVAEDARMRYGVRRVLALLDARMDQIYAAPYDFDADGPCPEVTPQLLAPEQIRLPGSRRAEHHPADRDSGDWNSGDVNSGDWVWAGNVFDVYGDRLPAAALRYPALPSASALLRLAPALLATGRAVAPADALPLYVRDKVAQTTAERAAVASTPPAGPVPVLQSGSKAT